MKPDASRQAFLRFLVTPVLAGVVLTILAPLGTDQFALLGRAVYWIGLCLAGAFGAVSTQFAIARLKSPPHRFLQMIVLSLGATLAVSPFVLFGSNASGLFAVALTLFYIWVIAIVITAVSENVSHRRATTTQPVNDARPALMERLPFKLQDAQLYAAVSEDHYLRVYTSKGDHMLLMRLADVPDLAHEAQCLALQSFSIRDRAMLHEALLNHMLRLVALAIHYHVPPATQLHDCSIRVPIPLHFHINLVLQHVG